MSIHRDGMGVAADPLVLSILIINVIFTRANSFSMLQPALHTEGQVIDLGGQVEICINEVE